MESYSTYEISSINVENQSAESYQMKRASPYEDESEAKRSRTEHNAERALEDWLTSTFGEGNFKVKDDFRRYAKSPIDNHHVKEIEDYIDMISGDDEQFKCFILQVMTDTYKRDAMAKTWEFIPSLTSMLPNGQEDSFLRNRQPSLEGWMESRRKITYDFDKKN